MIELRKANDRGVGEHGWPSSRHTFSFSGYDDPAWRGFLELLVINDHRVDPAEGFGGNVTFGFVAMLGTIVLSGMIMRHSVILVDHIRQDREAGRPEWEAIVESTVRRFRPIMLAAAVMGGLTVATILNLLFLPALSAAWYRVRRS